MPVETAERSPAPGQRLRGVPVSPGHALGPAVRVADPPAEPGSGPTPEDPGAEAARIRPAAEAVSHALRERPAATGETRAILDTTAAMASDPALLAEAEKAVTERGLPAGRAVHEAAGYFASTLAASGDYLAQRARDIRDVRDRIIAELAGKAAPGVPEITGSSVLVARDLAPADTADLDPSLVLALVTEEGGPTSHTAILARSLGIPAVVAAPGVASADAAGASVDGGTGEVELFDHAPPAAPTARSRPDHQVGAGTTADGHPVALLANVGSAADARSAADLGMAGCGLLRTEFCFLEAATEPDEDTQRAAYREILAPLAGKPVVVRTLDAGADKPLPFLDMTGEPNPALGVRGLRLAVDHPGLMERQLAAIAGAAADTGAEVAVMAPMVATPEEAAWFAERARAAGHPRAGVMVETPAAALSGPDLFEAVDFLSVGTNDLAQYMFAADRLSGSLARLNDPWQPALLRAVAELARAGQDHDSYVGVCGEAAADPLLAGILAGLGVTGLSMAVSAAPAVSHALAQHTHDEHERAARDTLSATGPDAARRRARAALTPSTARE